MQASKSVYPLLLATLMIAGLTSSSNSGVVYPQQVQPLKSPLLQQVSNEINGRTATEVRHPDGTFRKVGFAWIEFDASGIAGFTFEEVGRDDWSVYLRDPTRNVMLQLDLHTKKILYSDSNTPKAELYDIIEAKAEGSMAAPAAAPAPQPLATTEVNGRNAMEVQHSQGTFRKQGNGWVEMDSAGTAGFTFEEANRDDWSVYLRDPTRNVMLQLDLHQKKILYSDANTEKAELYAITKALAGAAPMAQPVTASNGFIEIYNGCACTIGAQISFGTGGQGPQLRFADDSIKLAGRRAVEIPSDAKSLKLEIYRYDVFGKTQTTFIVPGLDQGVPQVCVSTAGTYFDAGADVRPGHC